MAEWYYSQYGQTKGPVSEHELINRILKQELELEDYVMQSGKEVWVKIKDIPDLLDKIHAPENIPHKEVFPDSFFKEGEQVRASNLYFYVPVRRLILMSIFSLSLYQFYWMYKQWQYWDFKNRPSYQRSRGALAWLFFPFTIFQKIQYDKELNQYERANFSGVGIFWLWMGAGLAIYLPLNELSKLINLPSVIFQMLAGLDVLVLLPVQYYINRVNARLGNTFEKPTTGHYICLGIGVFTVLLSIFAQLFKALLSNI